MLIGVFWPSTALVKDSEQAPEIAGGDEMDDLAVAEERQTIRGVAEGLPDQDVQRFYELTQQRELKQAEALELARMVRPLFRSGAGEALEPTAASAEEIVRIWQAMAPEKEESLDLDEIRSGTAPAAGGLRAAGAVGDFFKSIIPRDVIRSFTVWQMKDRAGTVGTNGVGPVLTGILSRSQARVHMLGHSYGGKVVLSALCAAPLPRKVRSVLLLQPAVSHLCFAAKVDGTNRPGGYRAALERVERPIASTFSEHDFPLTQVFHKALRRDDDLGELRTAAFPEPPNRYAALGGFGPRGAGQELIPILDPLQPYTFDPAVRVYGVNGTRGISGHGDISNKWTWWLLHNQVRPE
jgi:pimeloyl-ACP methyl ester carboxylesterase